MILFLSNKKNVYNNNNYDLIQFCIYKQQKNKKIAIHKAVLIAEYFYLFILFYTKFECNVASSVHLRVAVNIFRFNNTSKYKGQERGGEKEGQAEKEASNEFLYKPIIHTSLVKTCIFIYLNRKRYTKRGPSSLDH